MHTGTPPIIHINNHVTFRNSVAPISLYANPYLVPACSHQTSGRAPDAPQEEVPSRDGTVEEGQSVTCVSWVNLGNSL